MSKGANNLSPRFSSPVEPGTGKITTPYRRFFSRLSKRVGPTIALVSQYSSSADFARAINAILAELRAQLWLENDTGNNDASRHIAAAIRAVTMIPAATDWGYSPTPVYTTAALEDWATYWPYGAAPETERQHAIHEAGNLTVSGVGWANVWEIANCNNYVESGEKTAVFGIPYVTKYYWDLWDFAYQDATYSYPYAIYQNQWSEFEATVSTDWTLSLDNLQNEATNCNAVSLFVSWFGDDLRAGQCTIKPKSVFGADAAKPVAWSVSNMTSAEKISTIYEGAAYGATPADISVIDAIKDLHVRGMDVSFTPFILMDIPYYNAKQDPYTGVADQPGYPWRGRITCDPAPGVSGSPDKTSTAATQIANFVGQAQASDFYVSNDRVFYSGVAEWSYRRMILHYAHLCALAGGVENFILGSELRGLTWVRSARQEFPFVKALKELLGDVRSILPDANIIYAADWSEFVGYQPPDGSGDLLFHLDDLWADANIDALGIDWYVPLSDWRDSETHLDYLAGHTSIYSYNYLMGNVYAGEGYDWYYASSTDRDNQVRSNISDGDYGEPWVWRTKDLPGWWQNRHHNRIAGVRQAESTAWEPESKPIWLTEVGCPAVDKGSNQPNVFVDNISSESYYPYYSDESADAVIQRRYVHSLLRFFDADDTAFAEANNPASGVYDGRMVDLSHIYIYTWDARPYSAFPDYSAVWGDAVNWTTGHWLTGRIPEIPQTQETFLTPLSSAVAPANPYLIDPATGKLNEQWRDFFNAIGYYRGDTITSVPSDPTNEELSTAVNAVIALLQNQGRIG